MLGDRQLAGHDHLAVRTGRQQRLEQQGMGPAVQLDQPGDLGLAPRVVDHVDQRRTPPPGQRRARRADGVTRAQLVERDLRRQHLPLELRRVDRHAVHLEAVRPPDRHQATRIQLPAEVADVGLQAVGGPGRCIALPDRLQQLGRLDRMTGVQHQPDEDVAAPGTADHHVAPADGDRQRAEQRHGQPTSGFGHGTSHRPPPGRSSIAATLRTPPPRPISDRRARGRRGRRGRGPGCGRGSRT